MWEKGKANIIKEKEYRVAACEPATIVLRILPIVRTVSTNGTRHKFWIWTTLA